MAFAIFRSPMNFFETTPAGRILNRFSRYVASAFASAPHGDQLFRQSDRVPESDPGMHEAVSLTCL